MSDSMNDTAHIAALRKQDKLHKLARRKVRIVGGKTEVYDAAPPAFDIPAIIAGHQAQAEAEAGRVAAEAKLLASARPGDLIEGHGVFLGTWELQDKSGKSLTQTFNVFAAPGDLKPQAMNYLDTVEHMSGLENWHGFNGTSYHNDKEFYAALQNGSYTGGWIIPPRDILSGRNNEEKFTTKANIADHRGVGALKNTFKAVPDPGKNTIYSHWYWSSTQHERPSAIVYSNHINGGGGSWQRKDGYLLSCRPVRLEPKP